MPSVTQLDHVALHARDPRTLAHFYEGFLGMRVVGRLDGNLGVFLASPHRPGGPDIEFFQAPEAPPNAEDRSDGVERRLASPHVALRVNSLEDLRTCQREVARFGGAFVAAINHGAVISCHVLDPEGNHLQLTWLTGFPMPHHPVLSPIDLELPDEEVMRELQELAT